MALLKLLTQAAITGGKTAFKAYAKKNPDTLRMKEKYGVKQNFPNVP